MIDHDFWTSLGQRSGLLLSQPRSTGRLAQETQISNREQSFARQDNFSPELVPLGLAGN